ncbi:prepilin-type N-terminal cleavage/methylation domain-containing protein [Candidatus Ichthyocystis sparus]|uniref:prepilin-type N-terminal cleavage/methylation domain-containing protein n=1 Tax=Candidatus Ichthyocystis sparus TaxID=1561004 RepID=UPI00159EEBF3|nr:prepilin-type N-terminal cleavage/methylation domain-containing protein [Candidatus Ichthyocystis sparus]
MSIRSNGLTLLELLMALVIVLSLFIGTKNIIINYSIENNIKKMAYDCLNIFTVGSNKGRQHGDPCGELSSDTSIKMNTNMYTASCLPSGKNLTITVVGKKSIAGITFLMSNVDNKITMTTSISGSIISKFDPEPPSTTINNCIVSDLQLNCIQNPDAFIPTP